MQHTGQAGLALTAVAQVWAPDRTRAVCWLYAAGKGRDLCLAAVVAVVRLQVAMVGSGAWACAAMHIVAQNCAAFDEADEFVDDVRMWVFEEEHEVSCSCSQWGCKSEDDVRR